MSYTKQEFTKGQILTADHLNHIEDGIESAAGTVMFTRISTGNVTDENGNRISSNEFVEIFEKNRILIKYLPSLGATKDIEVKEVTGYSFDLSGVFRYSHDDNSNKYL